MILLADTCDTTNEQKETTYDVMNRLHRQVSSQITSSYEMFDEDGDLLTLSNGLASKMINKNRELIKDRLFTINYRYCIVIFVSLGIIYCDYAYNSS